MAWSPLNTLGSNQSKSAGTTVVITTTAAAEVGNVVLVGTAWDADDAAAAQTTHLSVADSAGNTYTRAKEFTNGNGADAGVTVGLFYTVVTSELASGGTITVTNDTSQGAKAAAAYEYSKGAASVVTIADSDFAGIDANDPQDIALAGLATRQHLFIWVLAGEGPQADAYTFDTDYGNLGTNGTTGGGDASNCHVRMRGRVAILTGDTVATTSDTADRDYAQILVAFDESYKISADAGTYSVTGQAASVLSQRKIAAALGAYAISGQDANLLGPAGAFSISADPGVYAISGQAATVKPARKIAANAGTYSVVGQTAGVRADRLMISAPGGYGLIGQAAETLSQRKIAAVTGSYSISGQNARVIGPPRTIAADAGVYAVTGQAAGVRAQRLLSAALGSYTITGIAANLTVTGAGSFILSAEPGSYAVMGLATGLRAARLVAAGPGAYAIVGQNATLQLARRIAANAGVYAVSGMSTSLAATRRLTASSGSYAIVGQAAVLSSGVVSEAIRAGLCEFTSTTFVDSGNLTTVITSQTGSA